MATRQGSPGAEPPTVGPATAGAGAQAGEASGGIGATAGQVAGQVQDKAAQVADQAREQAQSRLESGKEQAAGSLGTVAHALRQTGQHLREQDQGSIAWYTDRTAEQIERLSGYLRTRDVNQLVREAERVARREPTLFVGGAFALGLLAGRFFKSSGQTSGRELGRPGQPPAPSLTHDRVPYGGGAFAPTIADQPDLRRTETPTPPPGSQPLPRTGAVAGTVGTQSGAAGGASTSTTGQPTGTVGSPTTPPASPRSGPEAETSSQASDERPARRFGTDAPAWAGSWPAPESEQR